MQLSQMEKFWTCDRNKENLQLISQPFFIENALENSKCLTVSGIIGDSDTCNDIQCIQYKDGITSNIENLDKPIEGADMRIILHIGDSIQSKNTRIVPLSSDTNVLVLVLLFMPYVTSIGLKKLWIHFGTKQKKIYTCP